jgi:hypothetical protein
MEDLHEVLICGVGIEDEKVIDQLRHVDVVLSRGQLASNWLLKNNITGDYRHPMPFLTTI